MELIEEKGYFFKKVEYFAQEYPDKLALGDVAGNTATMKDVLTICEETGVFLENLGLKGYERIAILSNSGFSQCLLHLPLGEKAVIVPIDYNTHPDKIEAVFKLFFVDYIITDNIGDKHSKIASEAGFGIISYKLTGNSGNLNISLELVQEPADMDRGLEHKKCHHLFIMTTSGTTSVPKVVPVNYRAVQSAVEEIGERYKVGVGDVFLTPVPMNKITNMTLFRMFGLGLSFIVVDTFNPADFFRMVKKYGINLFAGMPAAYEAMVRYIKDNGITINEGDFRVIEVFGAPLSRQLKESLEETLKAEVSQNYGMTETQHITSTYKAPLGFKDDSTGVRVLNESKISRYGEILIRGPAVFDGYENPEDPNENCFSEGWFHTGDIGYFDEDGYLFITGRIKEVINKGGEKISPYEIEGEILKNSRIKSAAVFPYIDKSNQENAGAVVVLNDSGHMALTELRRFLKKKIRDYHMPSILFCIDEIPAGKSQKVQRKQLYASLMDKYPDRLDEGNGDRTKVIKGQEKTKVQKDILKIWRKALGKYNIDLDTVFTEIGGDSVTGGMILAEIESKMGVQIPVDLLFGEGTVRKTAEYISKSGKNQGKYDYLFPIKATGSKKALFCAHSGEGDSVTYNHIAKYMEADRPVIGVVVNQKKEIPQAFRDIASGYADEIMKIQPEGPYHLCGHCFGGVLAFAIAEKIAEKGGWVGVLGMFDAVAHDFNSKSIETTLKLGRSFFGFVFKLTQAAFIQLKGKNAGMIFYLIMKKTRGAYLLVKSQLAQIFYQKGLRSGNSVFMKLGGKTGRLMHAYVNYNPSYFRGTIEFFQASIGTNIVLSNPGYWEKKADTLKIHTIDCYHNELVVGEYAKSISASLAESMDKFE